VPPSRSAGVLLYRGSGASLEVLLVHPGGPLWARRDAGAWSIPEGEYGADEAPLSAARREFEEELGTPLHSASPEGDALALQDVRQRSGKWVIAWALRGELDTETITSNTFELEWPPRSGQVREFPEVDRAEWFALDEARERINPAQVAFLDRLERALA